MRFTSIIVIFCAGLVGNFSCSNDVETNNEPMLKIDVSTTTPDMSSTDMGNVTPKTDMKVQDTPDLIDSNCGCDDGQICVRDLCIPDLNLNTMQRPNLPDEPLSERFVLPENKVWPADTNSPHITLWKDDNYAAYSITIDDNSSPDFDWWLDTADQFGFKVTWCVISGEVEGNNPFFGTWPDFQRLFSRGHALCAHGTVIDQPPEVSDPNAMAWYENEYKVARPAIEAMVPGSKADTIAHPWGRYIRSIVAQYYIAGRGTTGRVNKVNQTDYMNLQSASGVIRQSSIDGIMGTGAERRGWFMTHYHALSEEHRARTLEELQYLVQFSDDLWFGRFPDVVKYAQERDTATVTMHSSTEEHQILSLIDEMDDSKFDFPLTIKTRLPAGWAEVEATQNKISIPVRTVDHLGVNYALVDAVPNQGPIVVLPK